jgi:hypothetical protein
MMSTDPITAEMQAVKMMRVNNGGGYGVDDMPDYLKESAGIDAGLSGATKNIGVIDEADMDIRRIINGNSTLASPGRPAGSGSRVTVSASHMRGQNNTFIEFSVPSSGIGRDVSIGIFDSRGTLVWKASRMAAGARNQLSWDERDASGRRVAGGAYVVRVSAGSSRSSAHFVKVD